jgi:hypothetical protein
MRNLRIIANEVRADWKKVNYGAKPYLDAMAKLDHLYDNYYYDRADMIVRYFLSNASSWRGDKAREIKAELKEMLENK